MNQMAQEQQAVIDAQQSQIDGFIAHIDIQQSQIDELVARMEAIETSK